MKKLPFKNYGRSNQNKNTSHIFSTKIGDFTYRLDEKNITIIHVRDMSFSSQNKDVQIADLKTYQQSIIESLSVQYYRDNTPVKINNRLMEQLYLEDNPY